MKRFSVTSQALLFLLAGCAAPGQEVRPLPGDFAFIEVQLQG